MNCQDQNIQINSSNYSFNVNIFQDKIRLELYVYANQLNNLRFYSKHLELKDLIDKDDSQKFMDKLFKCFYSKQTCQIDEKAGVIRLILPSYKESKRVIRIQFKLKQSQLSLQKKMQMQIKRQEIKIFQLQEKNNQKINQLANKITYLKNIVKEKKQHQKKKGISTSKDSPTQNQLANPKKKVKVDNKLQNKEYKKDKQKVISKQKDCKQSKHTKISVSPKLQEQLNDNQKIKNNENKDTNQQIIKNQILNNKQKWNDNFQNIPNEQTATLKKKKQQQEFNSIDCRWIVGSQNKTKFLKAGNMVKYEKEGAWAQITLDKPIKYSQKNQQFKLKILKSKQSRMLIGIVCKSMLNSVSSYSSGKAVGYRGYDKCIRFSNLVFKMGNGFKEGDVVKIVIDWQYKIIQWLVNDCVSGQKPLDNLVQQELYPYVEMYSKGDVIESL